MAVSYNGLCKLLIDNNMKKWISININKKRNNVILGDKLEVL